MILEEVLAQAGNNGRFQIVFSLIILIMEVVIAWSMLQTALIGATPKWWCVDPTLLNSITPSIMNNASFQKCSLPYSLISTNENNSIRLHSNATYAHQDMTSEPFPTGSCVRYYDPEMVTIVSEWDLVCERKYIKALINSVQMAGVLIGSVISGQSSDTFGRRITCYVTMALHGLTCLAAGFSTSWQMYAVFRFFVGAAIGSYLVLHYVYMIEFVNHRWRPYLASVPSWALGAGMLCLIAWQVPNWRYLHFICAGITAPMLLGWFMSPESVRWLAAKGKVKAAEEVVDRIAKMNGRCKAPDTCEQLSALVEEEKSHGRSNEKYAYHTLFKGWRNAMNTLVLGFAWMSLSMSFYGIIFGVSALSGNVFLNMFLLSAVEVPLTLATSLLVIYVGRRWTGSMFFLLASLTGFGILIADRTASEETKGTVISAVAICSKLFIAAAWTCMQTFTVELYPTVIRTLGLGAANTAARVGGILAPFVLEMDTPDDAVRCYVIVGSVMAISGLSVLLLRETKGRALADTLHQDQKQLDL